MESLSVKIDQIESRLATLQVQLSDLHKRSLICWKRMSVLEEKLSALQVLSTEHEEKIIDLLVDVQGED